jgi:hypothetical protein
MLKECFPYVKFTKNEKISQGCNSVRKFESKKNHDLKVALSD